MLHGMTDRARKLLDEVLALPEAERADLAAEILESLPVDPGDGEQAAWMAELARRARAAHDDPDGGVPWETVRAELLDELRR